AVAGAFQQVPAAAPHHADKLAARLARRRRCPPVPHLPPNQAAAAQSDRHLPAPEVIVMLHAEPIAKALKGIVDFKMRPAAVVIGVIAETLGVSAEAVTMKSHLVNDLGADSNDLFMVAVTLSEQFNIDLDENE